MWVQRNQSCKSFFSWRHEFFDRHLTGRRLLETARYCRYIYPWDNAKSPQDCVLLEGSESIFSNVWYCCFLQATLSGASSEFRYIVSIFTRILRSISPIGKYVVLGWLKRWGNPKRISFLHSLSEWGEVDGSYSASLLHCYLNRGTEFFHFIQNGNGNDFARKTTKNGMILDEILANRKLVYA